MQNLCRRTERPRITVVLGTTFATKWLRAARGPLLNYRPTGLRRSITPRSRAPVVGDGSSRGYSEALPLTGQSMEANAAKEMNRIIRVSRPCSPEATATGTRSSASTDAEKTVHLTATEFDASDRVLAEGHMLSD